MTTFKLTIEYDGANFHGWQMQPGMRTVQGVLEEALATVLREPVKIQGAGRTDAGVHALGQVASFKSPVEITPERLCRGLSALAAPDAAVVDAAIVSDDFNARFASTGKHYQYRLQLGRVPFPHVRKTSYFVPGQLDLGAMQRAADMFVGEHDFAGFRASDCERENTIRKITSLSVQEAERGLMIIDVKGTAFLKNMVRILAGTLLGVGQGKLPPEIVEQVLKSGDRTQAGMTAPAHGLFLVEVYY